MAKVIVPLRIQSEELRHKFANYFPDVIFEPQENSSELLQENEQIILKDSNGRRLQIDFDGNHIDYKRKAFKGKKELLAKALGLGKGNYRILDLSAGLGMDAVFISQFGCEVCAIERNPILFFLLSEALKISNRADLKKLKFEYGNSLDWIEKLESDFDVIYFDPMYPVEDGKSALPRQEMVLFRNLVGDDLDSEQVLVRALNSKIHRVVVKRPLKAVELFQGVTHSFKGNSVRFDVYVRS